MNGSTNGFMVFAIMMKYKYHYQIEWTGLGLCHNDEVQISLLSDNDEWNGLGLCHNDEVQITLSDWMAMV